MSDVITLAHGSGGRKTSELIAELFKKNLGNEYFTADDAAVLPKPEGRIAMSTDGFIVSPWEFPGGKIEPDETPEQALIREIQEELNVTVRVGRLADIVEYDYPAFHLTMHCCLCELAGDADRLELREHSSAKWLTRGALDSVCWLPADQGLVDKLKEDDGVWEVTT